MVNDKEILIYVLDQQLKVQDFVVDRYSSLIWTERFAEAGDFELVVVSNKENRAFFRLGQFLKIRESFRLMIIETIEDVPDSEGVGRSLRISGKSIESVLKNYISYHWDIDMDAPGEGTFLPEFELNGTPEEIAMKIFHKGIEFLPQSLNSNLPFYVLGNFFPQDTLPLPDEFVTMAVPPDNTYDLVKEICDMYDIGFRLVKHFDREELYFNIYSGNDLTTAQSGKAPVVFTPELDNMSDVTELASIDQHKNLCYAYSTEPKGLVTSWAADTGTDTRGFNLRSTVLHVTDIDKDATPAEVEKILKRRGQEELAKHKRVSAFDGTVPPYSKYIYGTDYQLGDMVEVRNADGVTKNVRVTEQIFVSDQEGFRTYPTLTDVLYITPGSWFAWDYNQVWDTATKEWATA